MVNYYLFGGNPGEEKLIEKVKCDSFENGKKEFARFVRDHLSLRSWLMCDVDGRIVAAQMWA